MRKKLKNRLTVILILLSFLVISAISVTIIFALTQQQITTDIGVEYYPSTPIDNILTFTPSSDGESYSVTDYNTSYSGSITIPSTYNNLPVTSIGNSAFSGCRDLTSIVIPDSVTSIGNHAFYGCTGLTSVTIPDGVTNIGHYVFADCTGLTSVTIGSGVKIIKSYAFSGCTGLTSVEIPNSVTSIGSYVFDSCTGLTNVTIGSGVTSIGAYAFLGCSALKTVIFKPEGDFSVYENGSLVGPLYENEISDESMLYYFTTYPSFSYEK